MSPTGSILSGLAAIRRRLLNGHGVNSVAINRLIVSVQLLHPREPNEYIRLVEAHQTYALRVTS
jgi:hypothetical protein